PFLENSRGWIFNTDNDPKLGPLQNNFGPLVGVSTANVGSVPTHALLAGSRAIDAGSNTWATMPLTNNLANQTDDDPLTTDQRGAGFVRRFDAPGYPPASKVVDIGAYEAQEFTAPKVIDVQLSGLMPTNGQPWLRAPISFAQIVPLGKQLAPIFTAGV